MLLYRVITLLRPLLFLAIPVLEKIRESIPLRKDGLGDRLLDGMFKDFDLHLPWYAWLLAALYIMAQFLLPVYTLSFAFIKNFFSRPLLSSKQTAIAYYILEAIFLVIISIVAYNELAERFFTPSNPVSDAISSLFFSHDQNNVKVERIKNAEAVIYAISAVCSFYFIVFFPGLYKKRRK